jgi:hypothetical protein
MAMARNKARQMISRLVNGSRATLTQAWKDQRSEALRKWRAAVADHVGGRAIDIAELGTVGPLIGIPQSAVPETFANDCEIFERHLADVDHVAALQAVADESTRAAVGAAADVQRLYDELQAAIIRRDAPASDHFAVASASQMINARKRENGRLFDEGLATTSMELPVEPMPELEPVTAGGGESSFDETGAGWLPDND